MSFVGAPASTIWKKGTILAIPLPWVFTLTPATSQDSEGEARKYETMDEGYSFTLTAMTEGSSHNVHSIVQYLAIIKDEEADITAMMDVVLSHHRISAILHPNTS